MKKYLLSFSIAATFLVSACGNKQESSGIPSVDEEIPVKLMILAKTQTGSSISASGTFTTDDETFLSFKTGGVISRIFVKEGDKITKGQVLASLDATEIAAAVQQARLAQDKAKRDYDRVQNLYRDSVATLEQLQNAATGKRIAEEQFRAASFNLTFSEIRAAADGVVLRKMVNQGQVVGSGMPVLQTSSKGNADWLLKVSVSDREWSAVNLNDSAMITADALPNQKLKGYVSGKSENADAVTGSFTIELKLVNGKELNIASGMFGKATLFSKNKRNEWVIPYEALLDGNGNNGFVFVTNDKKKVKRVPVIISGIKNNTVTISEGLFGYKYLVTSGSAYLMDQSAISATFE